MTFLWEPTEVDKRIEYSHRLIDRVLREHSPAEWVPLLSGGHDSVCACHIASLHPEAPKPFTVYQIDTGIRSAANFEYVERVCDQFGWELDRRASPNSEDSYESFVRACGFPGPGMHSWAYARLKERVIQQLATEKSVGQRPVMFLSGCRRRESVRRMGYAVEVRRGDGLYETGHLRNPSRLWVAPCLEWMPPDQTLYMEEFGIPRNPIKDAVGLSGECFCGANARQDATEQTARDELALIREHCPDVYDEIQRLSAIARECGQPDRWGEKPKKQVEYGDAPCLPFMDLCIGCQR